MAWGVNEGVLDAAVYKPVIEKAWAGLLQHVYADGRLGDIQQTGPEPAYYPPTASYTYGVGAYLLAASELKRMAIASGPDPALHAQLNLPVPANSKLPTLFLVGDSTVRNGHGDGANNQMGWGDEMAPYFDTAKINVVNRAIGGAQLADVHHGRALGRDARADEAGRRGADPVRPQRQRAAG